MSELITITPGIADAMLARNYSNNRPISRSHVTSIAQDMLGGRWRPESTRFDPIVTTKDGILLNGQHRLTAISTSGVSVGCYIDREGTLEDFKFMDGGRSRSAADLIGCKNANNVASLLRNIISVKYGRLPLRSALSRQAYMGVTAKGIESRSPTRSQVVEYYNNASEYEKDAISRWVTEAGRMRSAIGGGPNSVYGSFLFFINYIDRAYFLGDFVEDFAKVAPESQTVTALKATIMKEFQKKDTKITHARLLSLLFCGYEHFIKSDGVTRFRDVDSVINKYDELMDYKRKDTNNK